jgi:hypothetical protein
LVAAATEDRLNSNAIRTSVCCLRQPAIADRECDARPALTGIFQSGRHARSIINVGNIGIYPHCCGEFGFRLIDYKTNSRLDPGAEDRAAIEDCEIPRCPQIPRGFGRATRCRCTSRGAPTVRWRALMANSPSVLGLLLDDSQWRRPKRWNERRGCGFRGLRRDREVPTCNDHRAILAPLRRGAFFGARVTLPKTRRDRSIHLPL